MTLVNAGIGGTNSKYGNQRVQNDVLQYNPDFVIVEFANNDAPTPEFQASYRQLVQTIVDSPSHPAVLLMFTMDRNGANSEDNQIPVGRDMNLPMVGLREAIYPEEQAGKLNPADVTADEIHPNDLGHAIIAQLIAFRLQSALN
jgi:lysophospholipase L1-like esterase